jgi:cysteine desulfurase
LEEEGIDVTYLDVISKGIVNPVDLENAITDKTILISVMFANNEIGTLQPIKEIAEIAKKHGVLFHTDAVQALGNVPIDVKELGIDMASVSGHKIYGPKGVGALYIKSGIVLPNFMNGGAQENNKRAGTENVPGIIGFGKAAELAKLNLEEHIKKIAELRNYFVKGIMDNIPDVDIVGDMEHRLPGNINLTFNGAIGTALRAYMNRRGIAASSGSACSANSKDPSHVLVALGLSVEKVSSSIRFALGDFTTKEDLDYAVEEITKVVDEIRKTEPREMCR